MINETTLEQEIIEQLKTQGFAVDNQYSSIKKLAKAFATATATHINTNHSKVIVASGSSAGSYPVI